MSDINEIKTDNIERRGIEEELKESYLDYSMSVIVSRALPDVRDGLKPVHRRILYAMNDMGMTHDKPFKKSARIVGEVLGKYHPHGDSAVYHTMVRMAQDFAYRYELIDGHGNFGSIDGDSAAAMRYTEARMAKIAGELLEDIDKNTIDYRKNFDDSLDEPIVLPARLPNLLLNGATGIAVGMATNIPPHNLGELLDGTLALIKYRVDLKSKRELIFTTLDALREKVSADLDYDTESEEVKEKALTAYLRIKNLLQEERKEEKALRKITRADEAAMELIESFESEEILVPAIFEEIRKIAERTLGEIEQIKSKDLIQYITGPDFPTGGIIDGRKGIYDAYTTGKGRVRVRGKVNFEELKNGKINIIITEIPYQVNKARLIEKIADLVKIKKITGITDLRDETARQGIRVVIELKKGEEPELILNKLYKYTDLQNTFGINLLALVNNIPKVLTLKEILSHYIDHRFDVVTRRTKFELEKTERRAHILEGFRIALGSIDRVIAIIRGAKDATEAREQLVAVYNFSEVQSKSILDMRLQRLTGLERDKIENEYNGLLKTIAELKSILANENMVYEMIEEESEELKVKYADERRTQIENSRLEINPEDLIKDEKVIVTLTNKGYVKRMDLNKYKAQKRGGKGVSTQNTTEGDFVENMYAASNLDTLMIFTDKGKAYNIKVYEIPESSKQARGKLITNLISLDESEKVRAIIKIREFSEEQEVFFATMEGMVKKTKLSEFKNINRSGLKAINLKDNDDLIHVGLIENEDDEIFIATKKGKSIKFPHDNVRSMGRSTQGVRGITLKEEDKVISSVVIKRKDITIVTVTENGYGKRTRSDEYPLQSRAGKGVINTRCSKKTGEIVAVKSVSEDEEIMAITSNGVVIRTPVNTISLIGRATQGVRIMRVEDTEEVVGIIKVKMNLEESFLEENEDEIVENN